MTVMDPYGGDPLIVDLGDGGDLYIQGGQPKMSSGLENAQYLSLFVDANWWGNDIDPANPGATGSRHFLPLTERIALTPAALQDMEKAALLDLAWMVEDGLLSEEPVVVCSILSMGVSGVEITSTEPDGTMSTTRWKLNWASIDPVTSPLEGRKGETVPQEKRLVSVSFQDGEDIALLAGDNFLYVGVYE